MAKISQLTATTSPADTDSLPIENTSGTITTKRITISSLASTIANKVKSLLSIGSASSLKTSSKEIVGAVNEVKTEVDGLQEWSIDISEQVGEVQSSVSSLSSKITSDRGGDLYRDKTGTLDSFDNPPLGWQQIDLTADYPVLNRPFDSKNGILFTAKNTAGSGNIFQMYSPAGSSENLYVRKQWYGGWQNWTRVNWIDHRLPLLNNTKYCNSTANTSQTWLMVVTSKLTTYKVLLVHYVIGDGAIGFVPIINSTGLNRAVITGGITDNWSGMLDITINFNEPSITLKTSTKGWTLSQVYAMGIYGFIYA